MAAKKPKTKYLTKALSCPDGSRKYIRAKTQAELDKKVREAQAQLGMGININDDTTVVELAQLWVDVYKRPHVKARSLKNTMNQLNSHILPVMGAKSVREVKPADCAQVMANMAGLSSGMQKQVLSTMRTLFDLAIENRIIAFSPVTRSVKATGKPPKERVPLSREQLDQLLTRLKEKRRDEAYTFVLLCATAGLRPAEASGLCWDCVDFDSSVIHVKRQLLTTPKPHLTEELKTENSCRTVPMPPLLHTHLLDLKLDCKRDSVFEFGNGKSSPSCRAANSLRSLSGYNADGEKKAPKQGKPRLGFYVHPHLLRHTYATYCFECGLDVKEVQALLGHADSKMTMDIYVHYLSQSRQDGTARKLAAAFPASPLVALG